MEAQTIGHSFWVDKWIRLGLGFNYRVFCRLPKPINGLWKQFIKLGKTFCQSSHLLSPVRSRLQSKKVQRLFPKQLPSALMEGSLCISWPTFPGEVMLPRTSAVLRLTSTTYTDSSQCGKNKNSCRVWTSPPAGFKKFPLKPNSYIHFYILSMVIKNKSLTFFSIPVHHFCFFTGLVSFTTHYIHY